MLRASLLSLTLGAFAAALLFSPTTVKADQFQDYAYAGLVFGLEGYNFNYESNRIANENNFGNSASQSCVDYAYYSFIYGYYGLIYEYSDWILQAGDLADASKEIAYGIFDYVYTTILPEYNYPQVDAVIENSFWGGYYMSYAEVYYDSAFYYVQ